MHGLELQERVRRLSVRFRSWPFVLWLVAFYGGWLALVALGDQWAVVTEHWPIAVAMAIGSYLAGSTPMGGGTAGFPILVLLLGEPASIGRDFSMAVQSVGMVSASIFIIVRRVPLHWGLLKGSLAGALVATPLGCAVATGRLDDVVLKMGFAVLWASFGVLHLLRMDALCGVEGASPTKPARERDVSLAVGLVGGAVSAIVGVGIDMILYAVLVLLYREDLKIAIPTSVVAMAFTSAVGIAAQLAFGHVDASVFGHWLAAAPVVAVGAPFGAFVVSVIPRKPTLFVVSLLCIGQFAWSAWNTGLGPAALISSVAGILAFLVVFEVLFRRGEDLRAAAEPGSLQVPQDAVLSER